MRVLILGATGRTGQELVKQSLEKGYEVVAYARRPEAIQPQPNLSVAAGTLENVERLAQTMHGVDAVLMALGSSRSKGRPKLFQWVVPNVIAAMKAAGARRVVCLSALGVGDTLKNARHPYKLMALTVLKDIFEDHDVGEAQFQDSGLDWTTVHPGFFFPGPRTERPLVRDAATGYQLPGLARTTRADVAQIMLRILTDPSTYGKKLIMASIQDNE